jgi:hypothetical protein
VSTTLYSYDYIYAVQVTLSATLLQDLHTTQAKLDESRERALQASAKVDDCTTTHYQ